MKYYTIAPSDKIAHVVRSFWVLEGEATGDNPYLHRALAGNCTELIFYYRGGFTLESKQGKVNTSASAAYGQNQQFYKLKTTSGFGLFGVHLYPYAIPVLFLLPANELTNQMPDLPALLQREGAILEEKVICASSTNKRVEILSDFIEQKMTCSVWKDNTIAGVIKNMVNNNDLPTIPELAENCCLSRRQFERKFKVLSGFSPKDFLRVTRFEAMVNASPAENKSLARLAAEGGYYDQSHFIHDFQCFSGYTPREFFRQKIDAGNYRAASEFKE